MYKKTHARCDKTVPSDYIEILNNDDHPGVCYICQSCRVNKVQKNTIETRLDQLEAGLNDIKNIMKERNTQIERYSSEHVVGSNVVKFSELNETRELSTQLKPKKTWAEVVGNTSGSNKPKTLPKPQFFNVICTNFEESNETLLIKKAETRLGPVAQFMQKDGTQFHYSYIHNSP